MSVEVWNSGGRCEAGNVAAPWAIRRLPHCHKRARWVGAGGFLLCGGCKRKVVRAA